MLANQITIGGANPIASFAGVGFEFNPIATITARVNGVPDTTKSDFQVQVDWGDSSGSDSKNYELVQVGQSLLVKASHTYQVQGSSYPVKVTVTGPGVQAGPQQTTTVNVSLLPDAASRPPQAPTHFAGALDKGVVSLGVGGANPITSFAGVGFRLNPISTVTGSYNGPVDNTPGHYKAQVNWGDGPSWDTNTALVSTSSGVLVKGSHTYAVQGNYDVTVYVTGPDGQTGSAETTSVHVDPLPDAASRPPNSPMNFVGARQSGFVTLGVGGANPITAVAGTAFAAMPVSTVTGSYNGPVDNTVGDYKAQVNWGDGPSWDTNTTLSSTSSGVLVKASHTYAIQGNYDVTVYVTGPDGQTGSAVTTSVHVNAAPPPPKKKPLGDFLDLGKTMFDLFDKTKSIIELFKSDGTPDVSKPFGDPTHQNTPLGGDFDGDGKADIAIFDVTISVFYIVKSGGGGVIMPFGNPAHQNVPVVGDYDGDGKADLALYDVTSSTFYILKSSGGGLILPFGNPSHHNAPVGGDYDGDGKTDLAIYDQTAGAFTILKSAGGGLVMPFGDAAHQNVPLAGDYDGDGKTDIAIYDETASAFYLVKSGGGGLMLPFGNAAHQNIPLVGDYDGDGKTDLAIFDTTTDNFYILKSSGGAIVLQLGDPTHHTVAFP